jgi:hypothetical protein
MRLTSRFSKPTPLPVERPSHTTRTHRSQSLPLLCLCSAILIFTAVLGQAQDYTSIIVFGDSLSDTGNFADLTHTKYGVWIPGPDANYADGRFTDGDDTVTAAKKYFGLWIEEFAAILPSKPLIKNSLDGGTNYAWQRHQRQRYRDHSVRHLKLAICQHQQYWPADYRLSRHLSRNHQ